jgi:PAS domain S-box-containing protein
VKIRTRINILLLLTSLFLPIACSVALLTEREVDLEMSEMLHAEQLLRAVSDLRSIAMETALLHDASAHARWQEKRSQLRSALSQLAPEHQYPGSRYAELGQLSEQIQNSFRQFPRVSGPVEPGTSPLEARTVADIFVTLQKMTEIGYELNRHDVEETKEALRTLQTVIVLNTLGLSLLMFLVWQLIRRKLLRPLQVVEDGTRRIADGDYQHRLALQRNDEIGILAQAFDRMTGQVERNQASLQAEIENSRRAEQALSDSVQYTETILTHAVDGILTLDQQCRIQSVNRAMATLFGYPAQSLPGRPFSELLAPSCQADWHAYSERLEQVHTSDASASFQSWRGQHAAGQLFPLELALARTAHRGQILYVGILRDISERLRIEKMKSELVSTVSHELRTPLTSISGALGLILGKALGEVPAPVVSLLGIAHKNSVRLAHLVNDLLDMEKLVAGKLHFELKVEPLMPLVEAALESVAGYGERLGVSFQIEQRADAVKVRVDVDRLQQVLANLLSNAAKYSNTGDTVQLKVRQEGMVARVEVIDRGPGIPPEFHSRIFQKFSQADSSDTREKGGTGLGLAISKELIERMNGLIGFHSNPLVHTCFYFTLPVWVEPVAHPIPSPGSDEAALQRILVIEDEPDIAELLTLQLQKTEYCTDLAHNATYALNCLSQYSYRLILLDLMLPDQSGIQLLREIRSNPATANIPVIVISAWVSEGRLALRDTFPDLEWIGKPYEQAELLAAIARNITPDSDLSLPPEPAT